MSNPVLDSIFANAIPIAAVAITVYTLLSGKSEKNAERAERLANAAKTIEQLDAKVDKLAEEQTKQGVLVGQHEALIGGGRLATLQADVKRAQQDIARVRDRRQRDPS